MSTVVFELSLQTIFVQISSYRDKECQWTIKDLFDKAAHPERIFVGICWQFIPEEDKDCFIQPYLKPDQVRVVNFHARDSKGVGWARKQSQKLWNNEDYVLQIDSHMRFVQDWDNKMITLQEQCGHRSVLTLYPPRYTPPNDLEKWNGSAVQTVKLFNQEGVIGFTATPVPKEYADKPQQTAAFAAGFFFGPGSIVQDIPIDPDIYFCGEEPALAARLWTHGYDLYSPNIPLIYHYYIRKDGVRPWDDDPAWHKKHLTSLKRLKALLKPSLCTELDEKIQLGDLGLGSVRTLEQYELFSGLNFTGCTVASYARKFPFVYSENSSIERDEVVPNSQAHLFFMGDSGIVFTENDGNLIALNTAATYVWCALLENWQPLAIVQGLAGLCHIDEIDAQKQYDFLLGHFDGLGLLNHHATTEQLIEVDVVEEEVLKEAQNAEVNWYSQRYYQLLDSIFHVHYASADIEYWGHAPIAHLEIKATDKSDWDFRLLTIEDKSAFYVNQAWVAEYDDMLSLAPHLKYTLMRYAISDNEYSLHLHTGVISNGTECLLLPGQKGSGKTVLTAAMMKQGYHYLSDEVALLEGDSCEVQPFPVAMCIKEPAFELLSVLYPELQKLPVYQRADGETVRYLAPPASSIIEDKILPAKYIVFPRYLAGSITALHPIEPIDALQRLLNDCQSMPKPLTLTDTRNLINWLETTKCFEMPHSDLQVAVKCLSELLVYP